MFDWLTEAIGGSPWTYALVLGIVAADAVVPAVPGETAVIAAAILAANDQLSIVLVLVAAIAGAVVGDNASYLLGRRVGRVALERLARGGRMRSQIEWSRRQLRVRGVWIVVVARFVPGGRTATTLAAGTLQMRWLSFACADGVGAALWAAYAGGLGWFGGSTFEHNVWKPLAVAAVVGILLGLLGEALRRRLDRAASPDAREA